MNLKQKVRNKIWALLLTLAMVLTMMPTMVFAYTLSPTEMFIDKGDIIITSTSVTGYDGAGAPVSTAPNADGYIIRQTDVNTSTTHTITVQSGTHDITLNDVNIDVSTTTTDCAFDIQGTSVVNLTLADGTTNTLKSGGGYTGSLFYGEAGLSVQPNASLNIIGTTGKLIAIGKDTFPYCDGGSGIGGKRDQANGTITINGGEITATGGYFAVGIGGNQDADAGGKITINGGTVTSTGGKAGAGIGGGTGCSVEINGGIVNATAGTNGPNGESGAGIGGKYKVAGGTITITGGMVTALGGPGSAGIGAGAYKYSSYSGGNITISGGTVTAIGDADPNKGYGAGIGGSRGRYDGSPFTSLGVISIGSDATVIAVSNSNIANFAISDTDGVITAPSGKTVANILTANFASTVTGRTKTEVRNSLGVVLTPALEYSPTGDYQSIAYSIPGIGDYTLFTNNTKQMYSAPGIASTTFGVSAGLNIFSSVRNDQVKVANVTVPANGTYKAGDSLDFTVNFESPVTCTGANATIPVTIGSSVVDAGYLSGSGTPNLVFRYTVLDGQSDANGISVGSPINLQGGTLKDGSGNDVALPLNNIASMTEVKVDAVKPTISSVARTDNTHITVTLSENCTNLTKVGDGGFSVIETGTPGTTYAVGSIAQGADASHVVLTVVDMGISAKEGVTVKYTADGNGTIQDTAGNTLATDTGKTVAAWDTTAPTILSANLASDNTYLDITFSEGVYGANDGTTALTAAKLALTFTKNAGTATNVQISSIKKNDSATEGLASSLTNGETVVRVFLSVTGTPNGMESIEIKPADSASVYDKAGIAAAATVTTGTKQLNFQTSASISSTNPTSLTEAGANDGSLTSGTVVVAIANGTLADPLVKTDVTASVSLPAGLDYTVTRDSATQLTITITGNATSHANANDVSNVTFTIAQAKVTGATADLTTGNISIDFADPAASIASTTPVVLTEAGANDGSLTSGNVVVAIANGTLADPLVKTDVTASVSLPAGLDYTVTRDFATQLTITITGNATSHANANDVSNVTFTIAQAKVTGATANLTTGNISIDFADPAASIASTTPVALTEAGANDGSLTSGTVVVAIANGTLADPLVKTDVTASVSLPAGLDYTVTRDSATQLTITITGNATNHANADDVSNLNFTIAQGKVTGAAADITTAGISIDFNNPSNGGGGTSNGGSHTPTPTPTSTTVTGSVIDSKTGTQVSNVAVTVTTDSKGNATISMNEAQAVILKKPDGTTSPLSDFSKVIITTATGSPVTISADGTIQVQDLAKGTNNNFNITYDLGNGQKITIGTMKINIDSSGKVNLTITLIDPYGIITDAATGKVITDADVTLYYADTERNKAVGKTPDSVVTLPIIDGFEPNDNKNSQMSDLSGAYGFMVFPISDYYIVATKDGYDQFRSPTIPVEQDIVKLDIKMNQPKVGLTRLAGLTRVDTALEIAKASYTGQVSNVILATAENFPDALAGSVLAYKVNAPILLVGSSEEDQTKVISYMKEYMDPKGTVYILGGTVAVSGAVEGKIVTSGFSQIKRLGGFDRYETALKIADELDLLTGTPIVLVYGENYPDALSISSASAAMQYPIFLVGKDGISDVVKQKIAEIKPIRAYIIGGQAVIGTAVEDQVSELTPLGKGAIVRLSGVNRYETSLAVANYFKLCGQTISVATGNNFPDALTGSAYAANSNAPIILVDVNLSETILNYLKTKKMTGATLFGGAAVVSEDIEQQLGQLLGK